MKRNYLHCQDASPEASTHVKMHHGKQLESDVKRLIRKLMIPTHKLKPAHINGMAAVIVLAIFGFAVKGEWDFIALMAGAYAFGYFADRINEWDIRQRMKDNKPESTDD